MQLQEKILELFSKKVSDIKSAFAGKIKEGKVNYINKDLLDKVISEQLLNWRARVDGGVEKNQKLSIEFIDWIIIEYNLKSGEKIDPDDLEVLNKVITRLKERGVMLDEEDINKRILNKKRR